MLGAQKQQYDDTLPGMHAHRAVGVYDDAGALVPGIIQAIDKLDGIATVVAFSGGGCLRLEGLSPVASASSLVPGSYCPQAAQ